MKRSASVVGLVAILLLAWTLARRGSAPDTAAAQARERADGAPFADAVLSAPDPSAGARRDAGPARGAEAAEPPPAASLRGLLQLAARHEAAGDGTALEAVLGAVYAPPHGAAAVLRGLAAAEFDDDAIARRGAVVALCVAVARDTAAGGADTLRAVLENLPGLQDDVRQELVESLAATRLSGRAAVGPEHLARIVERCRADPAIAPDLIPLLSGMEADAATFAGHRTALLELLAMTEVPGLAAAALRMLWRLDPAEGEAALAALDADARARPRLREALAQAIARSAPPARAAELLAGRTDAAAKLAISVLGDREEALESIRDRYSMLVAAGLDDTARVTLVTGMHRESPAVLLGILETDPSRPVREQAILTLTSSHAVDVRAVQALRDARLGGPAAIGAASCAAAAGNVVTRSSGPARAEALRLLEEIASDGTVDRRTRTHALGLLQRHLPADVYASLRMPAASPAQAGQ